MVQRCGSNNDGGNSDPAKGDLSFSSLTCARGDYAVDAKNQTTGYEYDRVGSRTKRTDDDQLQSLYLGSPVAFVHRLCLTRKTID